MENRRPPKRHTHFSVEDILSPSFSAKRPRRVINQLLGDITNTTSIEGSSSSSARPLRQGFLIDQLLDNINQGGAGTTPTPPPPKDYVKEMGTETDFHRRFKCMSVKAGFRIQDLPVEHEPEGLMAGIFQLCMDRAIAESRDQGINPTHLGCVIDSPLLNRPIIIPLRMITADTINTIFNNFDKVAQSKKAEGVIVIGEPFTVTVTTIDRSALPTKRKLKGGRRRTLAAVRHRIHDQCLIKILNRDDHYCLFYALQATMVDKTWGWPRWKFHDYVRNRRGQEGRLRADTLRLMDQVGVPLNLDGYDAEDYVPLVVDHWNRTQRRHRFRVFVFESTGHYTPCFKYGADDNYDTPLLLYYDNDTEHFDGVQKQGGLFGQPYCLDCELPYSRATEHRKSCRARCMLCARVGPNFPCKPFPGYFKNCAGCNKLFRSNECYQHHLRSNFCKRSKRCLDCGIIWDVNANRKGGREGHKCNERCCERCNSYHDPERGCFIQPLEPPERAAYRIVAFDLETTQHEPINPEFPARRNHLPNFVAAKVSCPECIASGKWRESLADTPCEVCGPNRSISFGHRPFSDTTVDRHVVTDNPLSAFVDWILYDLPLKFDTFVYSHFGGRFDMVLVFREIFMRGYNPDMLRQGNKMYEMKVRRQKKRNPAVTFRDSYNLMPCSLAALVPSYGLDVEAKAFFPHLCNRPDNYGRHIHPTKEDYIAETMMPQQKKKFDDWFAQNGHQPFLLDEALAAYCTNDVDILMSALVAFRKEFFDISKREADNNGEAQRAASTKPHGGIDVLRECMTIAGCCMRHFRTNHLPKEHLAIVPERGYDNAQNQSRLAMRFFHWYAAKHGVHIQTAHSDAGEKRFGPYTVDGWVESERRIIEVNGCAFHGCPKCHPRDNEELPTGKTAGLVRERDAKRLEFLRSQADIVDVYWECELNRMKEADKEMSAKFDEYVDDGPLDIRTCFMGGRTGPQKLFYHVRAGEKIWYYDFTSLYPYINFITAYPIGIPKIHILNEEVDWKSSADNPFPLALLKVFVVPPKSIDIPVLPVKVGDRLCFPLCMKCAKDHPQGGVNPEYKCQHNDQQRGWVSCCTTLELNAALDEGYTVNKVFRVLEYEKSDNKLFRPYISEFMAQKIHASGFAANINGNREAEAEFVRECLDKFGITIDASKMVPNKGKRSLAKLALNNLWGRFSLRNYGLSQTVITNNPAVLGNYLDNPSIEVSAIDTLNRHNVLITYMPKKDYVVEHDCSNIVVSLWTTSAARLLLLKAMQKVARTPGATLLYTDTDSLIFACKEDQNPLATGPHLGEFTDEYPDHEIVEFCSGGAKQYGLKMRKRGAASAEEFDHVLKLRGMTLNHDVVNNQGLRYEAFKASVIRYATTGEIQRITVLYPNCIRPSIKEGRVISCPTQKVYKPFIGKGIVGSDFRVLDFGYVPPSVATT